MRRSHVGLSVLVLTTLATGATSGCRNRPITDKTPGAAGSSGSGNAGGTMSISAAGRGGSSASAAGSGGAGGTIVATGGTGGTTTANAGSCGTDRITASEATAIYTKYAFEVQPGLNPTTVFAATELQVANLWEGLCAQLFYVSGFSADGNAFRDCTVVTYAGQIFVPTGECSQGTGLIASALVARGAFHFSWRSGSGVDYWHLGKLAPNGPQLTRTESSWYVNSAPGVTRLVLATAGADILVYRTGGLIYRADRTALIEWSTADAQLIGKLEDEGDRLLIVDDSGQPIGPTLP
jgi:hypothetical protein